MRFFRRRGGRRRRPLGFRVNGRGREVAVVRATGRLGRDARDPPRRARHGRLESPSDARSIGQGRDARFFLGSPSRRHVEGDDARHTHLALLQLRHHIGRDQVDGDAEVGSHPSPRRRHRHQACPTRSDGGWRRGRLSCSFSCRARDRASRPMVSWFDAKPALFEDAVVMSSKRARSKRRASQRPVRVSSAHHGNPREFAREASARRARRGARSRAPGSCLPVAQATA